MEGLLDITHYFVMVRLFFQCGKCGICLARSFGYRTAHRYSRVRKYCTVCVYVHTHGENDSTGSHWSRCTIQPEVPLTAEVASGEKQKGEKEGTQKRGESSECCITVFTVIYCGMHTYRELRYSLLPLVASRICGNISCCFLLGLDLFLF